MQRAIEQFRLNIQSVRSLDKIFESLQITDSTNNDVLEILRAEIVLVVSALDCFIHDVVRVKMIDDFNAGKSFGHFSVSMDCLKKMLSAPADVARNAFLEEEIRRLNGYKAFQEPEKISQALGLIGIQKIWEQLANKINWKSKYVKEQLTLIIEQRNRIAHEADINPSLGIGQKYSINRQETTDSVDFIEKICETIFSLINNSA
jgi:hypothetical protein